MGSRGRGRGRGSTLSFNLENLGVQKADMFKEGPNTQPIPLYPHVSSMPVPDTNYSSEGIKLVEMALRMKARWKKKSSLMSLEEKRRDIERYSDKYQNNQEKGIGFTPDWSQFPAELRPTEKKRKKRAIAVIPNVKAARCSTVDTKDILAKAKERLVSVEPGEEEPVREREEEAEEGEEKKEGEEDEEGKEDEEVEDLDLDEEEDTDYNMAYFDNGEAYGDEDVEDDEPVYNF